MTIDADGEEEEWLLLQEMAEQQETIRLQYPKSIRLLSLNCWGLKYISKHRRERLKEIGVQIASSNPLPDIVGLQECWTQEDYSSIVEQTRHFLPYAKYYYSGIFGSGLAILSKWPIEESSMFRYSLNGRPTAFWRGDWYVGKGVACARIRIGPLQNDVVQVFNTHFHAPYTAKNTSGSYLEHRTSQAWEIAKLFRHASERGHLVIGMGDFNIVPRTLAHRIICVKGGVKDIWRVMHPDSAMAAAGNRREQKRRGEGGSNRNVPTALLNLTENGITCDSPLNTWRWDKVTQKQLLKGEFVDDDEELSNVPDFKGKRLDYIFLGGAGVEARQRQQWKVETVNVGMTRRHPKLRCSLSDHFSVEATISCETLATASHTVTALEEVSKSHLPPAAYNTILGFIANNHARSHGQRTWRLLHFGVSVIASLGCFIGIWWSTHRYVSFILLLISTLGLSSGVIDGLIGGLFFSQEIRALKEWEWEVRNAKDAAVSAKRKSTVIVEPDRDETDSYFSEDD